MDNETPAEVTEEKEISKSTMHPFKGSRAMQRSCNTVLRFERCRDPDNQGFIVVYKNGEIYE